MCVIVCTVSWVGCFFHETPYTWETTDKLWLFRVGYLADIFSKMNMSLSFQGKQQAVFVPNDKVQLSSENKIFGKLVFSACFRSTYTKIGTIQRNQHGPCARMTCTFVKHSIFIKQKQLVFTTVSLTTCQYWKEFSDEVGGNINRYDFLKCIIKCVKIWKICITQWTKIFPNDWCMMLKTNA